MKIVTLNVLVDEKDADTVANHLAKQARVHDVCGLADFCSRKSIVIQDHGVTVANFKKVRMPSPLSD